MLTQKSILIILLTLFFTNAFAQKRINYSYLKSEHVLKVNREKFRKENEKNVARLKDRIENVSEAQIFSSLNSAQQINADSGFVLNSLKSIFENYNSYSNKTLYTSLATLNFLFPKEYIKDIKLISEETINVNLFIASISYLKKFKNFPTVNDEYINLIEQKFTNWEKQPSLYMLHKGLSETNKNVSRVMLHDLIHSSEFNGKTIIFTFLKSDRTIPGFSIIRKDNKEFVSNSDQSIFHTKQLGLAFSNFPGYIRIGNTPQGIFSIVGTYISPTETIGPTPIVLTRIPFEVSTKLFFHNRSINSKWNLNKYKNLLPESWKDYTPIYESFYAGKAGRRLIIMHGSTDDYTFYKNKNFYPLTPSKGCLTAKEIWDEVKGTQIESDQVKLIEEFYKTNNYKGYLVVLELDDILFEELKNGIKKPGFDFPGFLKN